MYGGWFPFASSDPVFMFFTLLCVPKAELRVGFQLGLANWRGLECGSAVGIFITLAFSQRYCWELAAPKATLSAT